MIPLSKAKVAACVVFTTAIFSTLSLVVLHGKTSVERNEPMADAPLLPVKANLASRTKSMQAFNNETFSTETTQTSNLSMASCFSLNSQRWLQGPYHGNVQFESNHEANKMILELPIPFLLEQTICHKDSHFLDWKDDTDLDFTALRLMYLAFHVHQHEPARQEALTRQRHCSDAELAKYSVGNFDYECPDARFLVIRLGKPGLGTVMRLQAVSALMVGVATNRVVLFVNNVSRIEPWTHASCDRRDFQCFYLPITPCVVTTQELEEAYTMPRNEMRQMLRLGEIVGPHANDRVLITKITERPHPTPEHFREHLVALAEKHFVNSNKHLRRAAEHILTVEAMDESQNNYYYYGHNSKVHHAAVIYAMRPRPLYAKQLDKMLSGSLPNGFDTNVSLGLPIRASDKCETEMECPGFEHYMKIIAAVWEKAQINRSAVVNIILTTESKLVMEDMKRFEATSKESLPFSYRFITNKHDVLQGTGFPDHYGPNVTADDVMLSSVAALKLQLLAKFSVGNCCSNFHGLLFHFLRGVCGAARGNVATICLQQLEDPELRVCCAWDKSETCLAKRREAQNDQTENNTQAMLATQAK